MANFGVVLNIVGKIHIIDASGNVRELLVGDEILASDTLVGVATGASKIVFSNGYEVELSIGEGWKDSKYLIIRAEEEITSDFFKHFDSSNAEQLLNSLILNEDFFNSLPNSAAGRAADLEARLPFNDNSKEPDDNERIALRADKASDGSKLKAGDSSKADPVLQKYSDKKTFVEKPESDYQDSSADSNNKATSGAEDAAENSGSSSTANPAPTEPPISFRQKFLGLMDTDPNESEIAALGITGVTTDSLAGVKHAILSQQESVVEVTDLQQIVDQAMAAFENIASAAEANNASTSNLPLSNFQMLGVGSMDTSNQQMIYSALNTATVKASNVTSVAAIELIIDSYNKVIAVADGTANGNAKLDFINLQQLGITGLLNNAQLQLFISAVDLMQATDIDSAVKLQLIADAVLAVTTAAAGATDSPSVAQLQLLGIDSATEQNLQLVQRAIRNTDNDATNVDSVTELQEVVSNAVSGLSIALDAVLEDSASAAGKNNADDTAVSYEQLSLIAENVRQQIIGEYQTAIGEETDFSNPPTSAQVQNIIDIVNAAVDFPFKAILEDSSSAGGSGNADGVKVTAQLLNTVALNVEPELEFLYQLAIANESSFANPPTPAQVQTLIDSVNNRASQALTEILEDSASAQGSGNANGSSVTLAHLNNVSENVRDELLVEYLNAIAAEQDFSNPPTFAQINTLLDSVNSSADLALQEILEDSSSTGGDSNQNSLAVSLQQLQAVAEDINELLEAQYQQGIAATSSFSNPPSVAQVQLLVETVNTAFTTALGKIATAAGKSIATSLSINDYWDAAVPQVNTDNLSLINDLLEQQEIGSVTASNSNVNQLVDSYLLIQAVATDSSGHAQLIDGVHYQNIGVDVSTDADVLQLLAQVIESLTAEQVSAHSEIQALANTVTKIMLHAVIGDTNLSAANLSALGVTGVTVDNLSSILADIAATEGSALANLTDLQALITAVQDQALLKIDDYNLLADGSAPAVALVLQDYQNAIIEGVQQVDVAMLNAAVLLQGNDAADSVDEIVTLLSNAKQAVVDIQALVDDHNTTSDIALASFKALGLAQVNESNLSTINALLKNTEISSADVQNYTDIASLLQSFICIQDSADGNRNSASADLPDITDYTKIGVEFDPLLTSNEVAKLLSDWIDGLNSPQVNTLSEIQQLVAKVETLMFAAKGNSGTSSGLEMTDLTVFGLTDITANNFASIAKKIVESSNDGSQINSIAALQFLIKAVKTAAIADIEGYNNSPDPTENVLTLQHYWDAGFDQVNAVSIDLYNAAIYQQVPAGADTVAKIQEVLTSADEGLSAIVAAAVKNDASEATTSVENYQQIGLTNVGSDNLAPINALLYSETIGADQVNSYALIKGLIDSYIKIQDAADGTPNSQGLPTTA
ncbi:hypothetical protein A9R01_11695, partial ['Osedax' symbiont bacterium Rs2_46_30_T18]